MSGVKDVNMITLDISWRPAWWIEIVRDFEIRVCGGLYQDWPDDYQTLMKKHYGFWVDDRFEQITFDHAHRDTWFMIKHMKK